MPCPIQQPSLRAPARVSVELRRFVLPGISVRRAGSEKSRTIWWKTAKAVEDQGAKALILDIDLAEMTAAKIVVDKTLSAFGRIDALLNIAGAVPQIDLFEMTDEQWDGGMALKLHGARRLTIEAWNALMKAKGSVVFTSGNSAIFPKAPYAAVGTINAAIAALAKAFSDRGISDGRTGQQRLARSGHDGAGRRSYLEHWAPLHNMTVAEAMETLSARCRHCKVRRTGGNRRTHGLPRIAGGAGG